MKPLRWLDRAVDVAAVLALVASGLLISINVVNRYLVAGGLRQLSRQFESLKPVYLFYREWFGSVSVMADEVPGYLLVWVAFLGAYLAMRQGGHIAFDLLSTKLSVAGQKALASINTALILLFLTMLMWQSIRMISVSGRTEIETAEIAQGWFMATLPLAAGLLAIASIDLIMAPIQMFSGVNKVVLLAIPPFIFMGELMGATSISDRIINLARALVGWMKGGLAHVNVVTSMFIAEMSGSAVADAAVMSKVFVPSMEKQGYPKPFAGAVTATSATLGIIIPPSIPMVLYGVTTNTSIKDLFIAGIVPGILLGGAFMLTSYIFARRENHPVDERFGIARLGQALKGAFIPRLIPVLVVGGLIGGFVTPTEAAALGVAAALAFGWLVQRDLSLKLIYQIAVNTVRQT